MSSRKIIRWLTAGLLLALVAGLAVLAGFRARQIRPNNIEAAAEQILGKDGDAALGIYNDFKVLERVQGKLIFALEALRTLGKSSGWHDIESVSVQLYNEDESKGPHLTSQRARFNVDTKDASLSGSVQVEFPDGTFLSTEVGTLLDGGRQFETTTNVVFVGDGLLGSAGAATYDLKRAHLVLSKGVVVRTDDGNALVAPELVYRRNSQRLKLPQGGQISFGGFTVESSEIEVVLEEGEHLPSKMSFTGGVKITGYQPESGQKLQAQCQSLDARRDSAGRWQITARSNGPWVRFMTVGGQDVVFQELLAWEVRAVASGSGLLSVKAGGRTCLHTVPLVGPPRTAESDSVRVWFEQGAATDLELLDEVVLEGDGIVATAHRVRLDADSGKVMLHGNPTGAKRVVVSSDRGRMTADQAVLFQESGRVEVRGRVQGEMLDVQLVGSSTSDAKPSEQPVHIASDVLTVTEKATVFDLRDSARMWQGQQLLTADRIRYWSSTNKMVAEGHVKTTLPARAVDPKAAPDRDIVLSSRSMLFEDAKQQAIYIGDVVYTDPEHRLQAGRLEIVLGQDRKVEKVIAIGAVSIQELATGRILTGNHAIRDIATGTVVLTGEPAKVVDAGGNMLSGRSLTWDQPSGRVSVSEETETIYHTEEEF